MQEIIMLVILCYFSLALLLKNSLFRYSFSCQTAFTIQKLFISIAAIIQYLSDMLVQNTILLLPAQDTARMSQKGLYARRMVCHFAFQV